MQYSEEIIASKVCIIMGDAGDEPKREQIVIILRFFSFNFFLIERLFNLVMLKIHLS